MQGPQKSLAKERSSAELRFASSLAPFWVWPGRRHGSAMNAYGALDTGLATRSLVCPFSLNQPKKGVDNADVVIHEVRSPARWLRASFVASRRSVFTRSPAFTGTSVGATTSHFTPNAVSCQ